jgi:hypothetical protein
MPVVTVITATKDTKYLFIFKIPFSCRAQLLNFPCSNGFAGLASLSQEFRFSRLFPPRSHCIAANVVAAWRSGG